MRMTELRFSGSEPVENAPCKYGYPTGDGLSGVLQKDRPVVVPRKVFSCTHFVGIETSMLEEL